jgi:hypothetical protein
MRGNVKRKYFFLEAQPRDVDEQPVTAFRGRERIGAGSKMDHQRALAWQDARRSHRVHQRSESVRRGRSVASWRRRSVDEEGGGEGGLRGQSQDESGKRNPDEILCD